MVNDSSGIYLATDDTRQKFTHLTAEQPMSQTWYVTIIITICIIIIPLQYAVHKANRFSGYGYAAEGEQNTLVLAANA